MRYFPPFFLLLIALLGCVSCTIWEKPGRSWSGATGGEQLDRQLWREISAQNWEELRKHLASTFTLTTTAGSFDREGAIGEWKRWQAGNYSLGDFVVKPNGADMVVSYTMVQGAGEGGANAFRSMSVWQQVNGDWLLIAQSLIPKNQP